MHRSYLYVPGDRPDRLAKALRAGCDAIIADLEDGVPPASKSDAREGVRAFIDALGTGIGDTVQTREGMPVPEIIVRVNPDERLLADLEAVVAAGARVIYLPKATSASVAATSAMLEGIEESIGPAARRGAVALVALVESARGILEAGSIAAHGRVTRLALGEADLTAELGIEPSGDRRELWPLRSALVLASAAAGIEAPTGPVYTALGDTEGLRVDTEALRRAGFGARSAVHPSQVAVINEVFTPSTAELAEARALVSLFERSLQRGEGVCVDDQGRMVDEAVIRSARRVLARGYAAGSGGGPDRTAG